MRPFKAVMWRALKLMQENHQSLVGHDDYQELCYDIMEWLNLPRVGVALPLWKFMYGASVINWTALQMAWPFYSFHATSNLFVADAREQQTEAFLKTQGTHLFCLDSDMAV
ncbi:MAG: hypothetical protein PVJ86_00325, partial [Phycisphaerales bacterium]